MDQVNQETGSGLGTLTSQSGESVEIGKSGEVGETGKVVESGEPCVSGKSLSHSLSNITSRSSRDARY